MYVGSLMTWNNNCSKDTKHRIAKATGTRMIWKDLEQEKIRISAKTRSLSLFLEHVTRT